MATLLLRLAGPLQSWGTTSRFDERDSQLEPSKSGVLGLLCAALGRDRGESLDDLAALRMGVRVDREGILMRDYQTATGIVTAAGKVDAKRTVISPRFYLADAIFLVGLEGEFSVLEKLQRALQKPYWALCLGRRSFPPGQPVWLPDGLQSASLRDALLGYPLLKFVAKSQMEEQLRLLLEDSAEGVVRLDQPIGPFSLRQFGPRCVRSEVVNVPDSANA